MAKPDEKITSILHTAIQVVEDADVDVRQFRNGLDTLQDLVHLNCMNCSRYVNWVDTKDMGSILIEEYFDLIKHATFAIAHIQNALPGQEKTVEERQTDDALDQVDELMEQPVARAPFVTPPVELPEEMKFGSKTPRENEHTREVDSQLQGIDKLSKQKALSKNARRQ